MDRHLLRLAARLFQQAPLQWHYPSGGRDVCRRLGLAGDEGSAFQKSIKNYRTRAASKFSPFASCIDAAGSSGFARHTMWIKT